MLAEIMVKVQSVEQRFIQSTPQSKIHSSRRAAPKSVIDSVKQCSIHLMREPSRPSASLSMCQSASTCTRQDTREGSKKK